MLALLIPVPGANAGEAMHHCEHTPHVEGHFVGYLNERGLGCDHARALAAHLIRHGHPKHYSCHVHVVPLSGFAGPSNHFGGGPLGRIAHCAHEDNHHGTHVRAFALGWAPP